MQHYHIPKKDKFWPRFHPPKSYLGDWTLAFKLKSSLICYMSIAALHACKISAKILTTALVITKFEGGVKGDGVKFGHCHA